MPELSDEAKKEVRDFQGSRQGTRRSAWRKKGDPLFPEHKPLSFLMVPHAAAPSALPWRTFPRITRELQDHDHSSAVLTVLRRGPTPERPRTRP
jgi:hypothetical protein